MKCQHWHTTYKYTVKTTSPQLLRTCRTALNIHKEVILPDSRVWNSLDVDWIQFFFPSRFLSPFFATEYLQEYEKIHIQLGFRCHSMCVWEKSGPLQRDPLLPCRMQIADYAFFMKESQDRQTGDTKAKVSTILFDSKCPFCSIVSRPLVVVGAIGFVVKGGSGLWV